MIKPTTRGPDRSAGLAVLVLEFSIAENIALHDYRHAPDSRFGWLFPSRLVERGARLIGEYDVRGGGPYTRAGGLSGGNQQKVVLAREVLIEAEAAEEAGFSSLWVMDHLLQLPPLGGPAASMLEGYVTLGALAAVTKRVELGTLVTGVTYRNPALLAKQIADVESQIAKAKQKYLPTDRKSVV